MQEGSPAPCTDRAQTYPSFRQIPVVDEARRNHRLLVPVAAVAVVETGEGAEFGLREGETDLPGAACREQGGGDERGLARSQEPLPITARRGGKSFGRGEWSKKVFGRVGDQLKHL